MSTGIPCCGGRWWAGVALVVVVIIIGCTTAKNDSRSPREQPASTPAAPPASTADSATPDPADDAVATPAMPTNSPAVTQPDVPRASVKIDSLAQHQQGWLRIRRQSAAGKPSTARGALEKNGAFRISTSNVQSFSIDARALPVDTSRQIIMHIDGQNMVVFANGDTLTFLRARNGNWEYQKE